MVSILWTFQIKLDNFWALFFPINTPRPFAGGDIEGKNNGYEACLYTLTYGVPR